MDESSKIIKEYFSKLSPDIKKAISSVDWNSKVADIGKKYSLNEKQISDLQYEVMFTLIGMEDPENLEKNILNELSVSQLLSTEIANELEKRVFPMIMDYVEKKEAPPKVIQQQKPQTTTLNTIPEIRPVTLPAVEKKGGIEISVPRYAPVNSASSSVSSYKPTGILEDEPKPSPAPTPTFQIPKFQPLSVPVPPPTQNTKGVLANSPEPENVGVKITYSPIKTNPVVTEPIQKPAFVPRIDMSKEVPPVVSTPNNIIDSKLNSVTSGVKDLPSEPAKENPIVKQYTVDPYREALG